MNILTVNLLFSTLVFWVAAKLYLLPKFDTLQPKAVLLSILLLHSTRHLGLMFLAPGGHHHLRPARSTLDEGGVIRAPSRTRDPTARTNKGGVLLPVRPRQPRASP